MKRPVVLIVGAAAGALIVAAVGASAHTGLFVTKSNSVQSSVQGDEATGARTESPEPSETPEPTETPEAQATEKPEAADTDTDENDDAQGDEDHQGAPATGSTEKESGHHEGSGSGSGGGGGHDD